MGFHQITMGKFVNRGMLAGPYCPIYGFGCCLLIYILLPFTNNILLLTLGAMLVCTLLEALAGFVLDKIFHQRWWDYSKEPYNIDGYICLKSSVTWGIGGAILVSVIHPVIELALHWFPYKLFAVLVVLWLAGMLLDTVVTVRGMLKIKGKVNHLAVVHQQMQTVSCDIGRAVSAVTAKAAKSVEELADEMGIAEKRKELQEKKTEFENKIREMQQQLSRTEKRLIKAFPKMRGTRSAAHKAASQRLKEIGEKKE